MNDLVRRAFALAFAFLLVTSIPFAVVELGGPDVSPAEAAAASHGGTHIDDFEDGDTNIETSGWSGWTGATGSLSTESADPISGSHSGKLEAVDSIDAVSAEADSAKTPTRIATKFRISTDSGSTFDGYKFRAESGSTKVMEVYFEPASQSVKINNGGTVSDTGKDWHGGAVYAIEFRDIDFSNDTYDLYINGERWHDDATFVNSVSDIDNVTVESDTNTGGADPVLYFDDVETDGSDYTFNRFSSGAVDTVEDSDTNIEAAGWYGYVNNSSSALSVESDNPIHGDHSLKLEASGDVQEAQIQSNSGFYKPSRLAVAVNLTDNTGAASDGFKFIVEKGDTRLFWIYFEPAADKHIKYQNTETDLHWQPNTKYHIEIRDINWSAGTYDLYIDAEKIEDDVSFDTASTEGFDVLTVEADANDGGGSSTIVFDNIEVDGGSHTSSWSDGLTDDVENGKVTYERSGWSGRWDGSTGELSVNSSGPLSGSHSLTFANGGDQSKIWTTSTTVRQPTTLKWTVSVDDQFGSEFDHEHFQFEYSSGDLARHAMEVRLSHDGNVEVADGSSFVDASTWSADQTYTFEIRDIDWSGNTYDVYMDGSIIQNDASFGNNVDGIQRFRLHSDHDSAASGTAITFDDMEFGSMSSSDFSASEPSSGTTVSGTVVNQHGDPVQNATVQVWGVDYSQITPDADETEKDQALDLLEDAQEKTPTEWTDQIESGFTLVGPAGHFSEDGIVYAAVHRVDDWKLSSTSTQIRNDPTLESPILSVDAARGETVTLALSAWDSDKFGIRNTISPVKNDLPGEPIESQIVVETLVAADGKVGTTQTTTTELNCNFIGCDWSSAFVEVTLSPGFYRVYPKGHSSSGYVIKVGDPIDIISENLKNEQNQVTDQAAEVTDRLSSGKFVKVTTTTAADGSWSVSTGTNVKTVAVQAYKAPGVSVNDTDLDYQTIIDEYSDSYQDGEQLERLGSVYLPSQIKKVDPPASNVTLTTQEMTFPPYGDQTTLEDMLKDLLEEMLNETLTQTKTVFTDLTDEVDRSSLEDTYETLRELYRDNAVLREIVDQLDADSSRDLVITDDPSSLTDTELQDSIYLINQGVETVGSQLDGGVDEEIGNDTISQTWTFAGDIREDTLTLLIHWSNGSTTTLSTESQYLRVDKRAGLGDQVLLEDYPINSSDPSSLTFELLGVGEENGEVVREKNTVRNPRFDGDIPSLDAIELTSLEPGPSDQVDIELHPRDAARFGSIVSATVTGPDGTDISTDAISSNGRETGFKTSGSGVYHVALTFNNSDGDQFTETIRVFADDFDDDRPPSAQIRTGPTGRYLVVGDGLESGSIDVGDDGAVSVATRIQQDADAPGSIQLYLQSVDTGSRTEVTVKVVRGSSETAVQRQVGVILHMNQIDSERAVLYREETEPLPRDGSNAAGIVDARENGTTIETFTEGDGAVTVLVENDPGLFERALYRFRGFDLPGAAIFPPFDLGVGGLSSSSIAGGLAVLGLAGGVRRWNA